MTDPTSSEHSLASSANPDDWRPRWQQKDAWTLREFAQLCCGWNPDHHVFPDRERYNEALDSVNRAVRVGALPTMGLMWPGTNAERLYDEVPLFRPGDVAQWAAARYPHTFPAFPVADGTEAATDVLVGTDASASLVEADTHGTRGGPEAGKQAAAATSGGTDADLSRSDGRMAAVSAFLERCNEVGMERIEKRHIWRAIKHKTPRQFQYWLQATPPPKGTRACDENVRRILCMKPADFIQLLKTNSLL